MFVLDLNGWSCDSWIARPEMNGGKWNICAIRGLARWLSQRRTKTVLAGYSIGVQLNEIDSKRFYSFIISRNNNKERPDNLTSNETSWRFDFILLLFFHSIKCNQITVIRIFLISLEQWVSVGRLCARQNLSHRRFFCSLKKKYTST